MAHYLSFLKVGLFIESEAMSVGLFGRIHYFRASSLQIWEMLTTLSSTRDGCRVLLAFYVCLSSRNPWWVVTEGFESVSVFEETGGVFKWTRGSSLLLSFP